MNYKNPSSINSPKDYIEDVNLIYDEGEDGVSVAEVVWDGQLKLAIRWNVARREWDDLEKSNLLKDCVGMPSSRGYPVWFILPETFFDSNSKLRKQLDKYLDLKR